MEELYLKLSQKKQVQHEKVLLGEIASLSCAQKDVVSRLSAMHVANFDTSEKQKKKKQGKQRQVLHVTDLITKIHEIYPTLTVNALGETELIIEYVPPRQIHKALEFLKVGLVCLISFFGSAFTIITFNNDVSAGQVFSNLYTAFTGQTRDGATVLEIMYSVGLAVGIIAFFNHFNGHRLTTDPTPIEVEMTQYEYDVNKSLISSNEKVM